MWSLEAGGLYIEYIPEDCSSLADDGDEVEVHYTGTLQGTGQVFDSSRQPGRSPLPFMLGKGKVIPGWEQGIKGMCVGEKRELIIPPHLAYGKNGHPPAIPPESTLVFETELMALKKEPWEFNILPTLRFLVIPAFVLYIIYYVYNKYKEEGTNTKQSKQERKASRKKRN